MKTTLLTLIALAITVFSFGQAPEAFKYQAVVRDAGGAILSNQSVGYQLSILQGAPTGTAVYTETFTPTTNAYGLVNLEIGTGTTTDDFSLIDWANGPFYMETAVDVTGGTSYAIMGTSQLVSVPYALYAKTSGSSTPGPQGPAGNDGADGADGLSAYEVWLAQGNTGTEADFINSLQGATGPQGPQGNQGVPGNDGADGATGPQGIQGEPGVDGVDGTDGLSAYEIWLAQGNTGTEADFINSLQGATGPQGPQGIQGDPGVDGVDGTDGLSAYEIWLAQGNIGTEADFINSLQGATGPQGPQGFQGNDGLQGPQGIQGVPGNDGIDGVDGQGGVTTAGINVSITGAGTVGDPYVVNATDNVNDADADPTNELQDISLTGNDLTISSGSTVDLSVIQDGVNDADADPNNELQAVSFSNDTLYLSNGGQVYLGAYGIDLVDDADNDPANELQTLAYQNDTLYLSSGNSVPIITSSQGSTNSGGVSGCLSCISQISTLAPAQMMWHEAGDYCQNLIEGGYSDWRLPTYNEMIHYRFEMELSGPWHNYFVWSSSKSEGSNQIHAFKEDNGQTTVGTPGSTNNFYCRCVR